MTLKDLLYSSLDGDMSKDMSKEELLSIDIHVIEFNDDLLLVGSSFSKSENRLDILL